MFVPRSTVLATVPLLAVAAGCGSDSDDDAETRGVSYRSTIESVDGPEQRLAVTYDCGVLVLRGSDGEVLADLEEDGFLRVSPAGDERHVLVSEPGAFSALDLGAWTVDHGDHEHSYVDDPAWTEFAVPAEEPGHVVPHHGRTTLFDDASGTVTSFESGDLADLADGTPELAVSQTADPHHGVAVTLEDGTTIRTVGTTDVRSGVEVVDPSGTVVASSPDCPGVHGEAFAEEVAGFGCEDGVLLVEGSRFTKIAAQDAYGRSGTLAGSDVSPYLLGDYKTDPDAELERPTRVTVIDTQRAASRLVELGTSYSFRSLGRTPDGDGLVLGTDGSLHVVDVRRGQVVHSVPVVGAWEEPVDWEDPRPALEVVGDRAYVTEPATRRLHVVDLAALRVVANHELPEVPNEVIGVTG